MYILCLVLFAGEVIQGVDGSGIEEAIRDSADHCQCNLQ